MLENKQQSESGFSLLELVVVLAIAIVLSLMAVMSFSTQKLHKADRQATELADIMQEAKQLAISQRRTIRLQINATEKVIRLINEGTDLTTADDDVLVKTALYIEDGVFMGTKPSNVTSTPSELSPTPEIVFKTSTHPLSSGDSVATVRFLRNGRVTDAGNDAIGTGSIATGSTIYVWSKHTADTSSNPTQGQVFRSITVLGSSGLTRLWKCPNVSGQCSTWSN